MGAADLWSNGYVKVIEMKKYGLLDERGLKKSSGRREKMTMTS